MGKEEEDKPKMGREMGHGKFVEKRSPEWWNIIGHILRVFGKAAVDEEEETDEQIKDKRKIK